MPRARHAQATLLVALLRKAQVIIKLYVHFILS